MKEININIEGYNVNGICVGCLNYDRRMYYNADIKMCYKLLADIEVPDGLEIQVCWECLAYIKKAMMLRNQILTSYEFLISYSRERTFLDSPNDFKVRAVTRLSKLCYIDDFESIIKYDEDIELKIEAVGNALNLDSPDPGSPKIPILQDSETLMNGEKEFELKLETVDNYDLEIPIKLESVDNTEATTFEDLPLNDFTSDEDIQLSLLKEKSRIKKKRKKKDGQESKRDHVDKTDRIRKRKHKKRSMNKTEDAFTPESNTKYIESESIEKDQKKNRRLKNLPEDIVELYTMAADEMETVRSEDRQSKEFLKLKYKCDDCIIGFNTEKLKIEHMNGKHQSKGDICHRCPTCQGYFLTKDNLSYHRALHLNAYKCVICSLKTTLKMRMLKHVATHKHVQQYVCDTCGVEFSTKSKLSYHRAVCAQEKPQCDCCGKVFANKMTLKYHLKLLPQNKSDKPKEKLFIPCKGCDKIFHSKKSYRAHVVIHDGLTYPCPICGKLFQWKRNLARHTRNHKEKEAGELHECRACGKSFASRDCYNNHMRLSKKHVQEDAYQHECSYCGKKYATKWCLTDHIDWDHMKRIKYQCNVCFKAFKTAKIMVAHVNNIHEGKKKEEEGEHLCDICGKSYKTVKRLKGHVWAMHTKRSNMKSYKCKLCPATFTWQTSIYKHMKMMHDANKKTKNTRNIPPVKKEDPFPGIELANRMQYFQQEIGGATDHANKCSMYFYLKQ